ncbi:MAG: type I-E CRISPR-associated protein Cas5/CasD [Burkholderiaceae bacterium]|nr:type I-E CRISPR-associated protein Cas5/CasD [Burkholderiaceae bacterium]
MSAHLLLRLEAPMLSLGSPAVDQRRPVQRWPAASLLTGLLGNALGCRRDRPAALDRLQERLRWAARIDRAGHPFTDFQTAQLHADESGWTTRGTVETRAGGANTYDAPHIRWRNYRADASLAVALRLDPTDEAPTLDDLAAALQHPARPLFIGRKNCLPSQRLLVGLVDAADTVAALAQCPLSHDADAEPALFCRDPAVAWPGPEIGHRSSDERRFALDVHAGQQTIRELLAPATTTP